MPHPKEGKETKATKAIIPLNSFDLTPPLFQEMYTSVSFKAKLFKPCRKLLQVLKFRFKRPIFKPFIPFRKLQRTGIGKTHKRKRFRGLLSVLRSSLKSEAMDEVREIRSLPETGRERALFPSPLTPAYIKMVGEMNKREASSSNEVEDACRSFENYLVEMIVDEGKLRDLNDVEELLYCWRNLKCPVFHDLVCRFYGELCKDLFSGEEGESGDPN